MLEGWRALCAGIFLMSLTFVGIQTAAAQAPAPGHRLAIHVDSDDPETMNLALNNIVNAKKLYDERGEAVSVEIVTYGPGITMLRGDTSPVRERLAELKASFPALVLSMCGNSKAGAERREGKEVPLLPGARVVPAGIVRLMELQEQGYSYVKP